MIDYRLKQNRREYFDALYAMNLHHRVMPGLVYLYMPELVRQLDWGTEQRLWFAFLNGCTQNPITSMVIMEQLPECPSAGRALLMFSAWFDENWANLQFDTDRRYAKKLTVDAIKSYADMVAQAGSQQALLTGTYPELWARMSQVISFGRLSTFSYLEYVKIMGWGADCDDLMFGDLDGSRSHRNGMLMLLGLDHLVMDKRANTGVKGYKDLKGLASDLSRAASLYIQEFEEGHQDDAAVYLNTGNFTLESNLCTFKNHFYGRRYPGVYADMAWDRIVWADEHGLQRHTEIFKEIRLDSLPEWLLIEVTGDGGKTLAQRAQAFPTTGFPYRGEFFLPA